VVARIALDHLTPERVSWRISPYPLPKWREPAVSYDLVLPELHWRPGKITAPQQAAIDSLMEALSDEANKRQEQPCATSSTNREPT